MPFLRGGTEAAETPSRYCYVFGGLGAMLALAVFYVDTFTDIESAVAVLYVVALLVAAEILSRRGAIGAALVCVTLTTISYFGTHGLAEDFQATLRFLVALAALSITTGLILRNKAAQEALLQTNAALAESEMRYRSIFERTRVALWERDYTRLRSFLMELKAQGVEDLRAHARAHPEFLSHCVSLITAVAANEAAREMMGPGLDPAQAMHRLTEPSHDRFIGVVEAIWEGAPFFEDKMEVCSATGEEKRVLFSVSLPSDPAGFNRVVVSMVDITQREMAQQALAEAKEELAMASRAATVGALSASLAHELNQPLGAIVVNAQTTLRWLDRDPPDLAAVRRTAERMVRDSQRASEIIHNTRKMLSQAERKSEMVDLAGLVEDTLALMEHDLTRTGVLVDVRNAAGAPSIRAVRIELQQVLINLINNAIQAMDCAQCQRRIITIEFHQPQERFAALSVRDSGPGMDDAGLSKLFTPFHTTKPTGMGMGLSICRSTIEAAGGTLDGNNHPDGGAVFHLRLPMDMEMEHV